MSDLARHQPIFLSSLHADNKIDIDDRVLNEREATYKGSISAKHIVFTQTVRFPSFNKEFSSLYHPVKYGLTNGGGAFTKRRTAFMKAVNHDQKAPKETDLLEVLATHYASQLEAEAQKIAAKMGGYLVYLGLDGTLRKAIPTTLDVRTERQKSNLGLTEMLGTNLKQYHSTPDEDTDSEEEFPALHQLELLKAIDNEDILLLEKLIARGIDLNYSMSYQTRNFRVELPYSPLSLAITRDTFPILFLFSMI